MVVATCKGMSLCRKEGHLVVTTYKGMSHCAKEGDVVVVRHGPHAKGCHFVVRRDTWS